MSGATTAKAPRATTAGGVIGTAIGLLALVGSLAFLAGQAFAAGGKSDAELLDELMPAPRPLGLELVQGARLPSGERLLRLAPADAPPAQDGAVVPEEVVLVQSRAASTAARLFREGRSFDLQIAREVEAWQKDPAGTLHTELERGEVAWGGWRAPFVRERAFLESGAWRDAQRVNLSTPGGSLVLIAIWPEGHEPAAEALRPILDGVALPEPSASDERADG